MTHKQMERDPRLEKIFRGAAKSALFSWSQNSVGARDLENDLWVRFLESPASMKKIVDADDALAKRLAYKAALQILAKQALSSDVFKGVGLYSSESVKDALAGQSKNRYLLGALPRALKELEKANHGYAEAIRSRYDDGVLPEQGSPAVKLTRAIRSLTEHVNMLKIEAGGGFDDSKHQGPKLRRTDALVDPDTVSASGRHSDPTADTAILLIEHPELRDDYLHVEPITEYTGPK